MERQVGIHRSGRHHLLHSSEQEPSKFLLVTSLAYPFVHTREWNVLKPILVRRPVRGFVVRLSSLFYSETSLHFHLHLKYKYLAIMIRTTQDKYPCACVQKAHVSSGIM